MRAWMIAVVVVACGGPKPTPALEPAPATAPCDCRATCVCRGTDDPDADLYTLDMLNTCAKAGVTCEPCPDCDAPSAE